MPDKKKVEVQKEGLHCVKCKREYHLGEIVVKDRTNNKKNGGHTEYFCTVCPK